MVTKINLNKAITARKILYGGQNTSSKKTQGNNNNSSSEFSVVKMNTLSGQSVSRTIIISDERSSNTTSTLSSSEIAAAIASGVAQTTAEQVNIGTQIASTILNSLSQDKPVYSESNSSQNYTDIGKINLSDATKLSNTSISSIKSAIKLCKSSPTETNQEALSSSITTAEGFREKINVAITDIKQKETEKNNAVKAYEDFHPKFVELDNKYNKLSESYDEMLSDTEIDIEINNLKSDMNSETDSQKIEDYKKRIKEYESMKGSKQEQKEYLEKLEQELNEAKITDEQNKINKETAEMEYRQVEPNLKKFTSSRDKLDEAINLGKEKLSEMTGNS